MYKVYVTFIVINIVLSIVILYIEEVNLILLFCNDAYGYCQFHTCRLQCFMAFIVITFPLCKC